MPGSVADASPLPLTTYEEATEVVAGLRLCIDAVLDDTADGAHQRAAAQATLDDAIGANGSWLLQAATELLVHDAQLLDRVPHSQRQVAHLISLVDQTPPGQRAEEGIRRAVLHLLRRLSANDDLLIAALPLAPKVVSWPSAGAESTNQLILHVCSLCIDRSFPVRIAAMKSLANFDFILGAVHPFSAIAARIFEVIINCLTIKPPNPNALPWSSYHRKDAAGVLYKPPTGGFHPDGSIIDDPPEALLVDAASETAYTLFGSLVTEEANPLWLNSPFIFGQDMQVAFRDACRWRMEASESLGSAFAQSPTVFARTMNQSTFFDLVRDGTIPTRLRANSLWMLAAATRIQTYGWDEFTPGIVQLVLDLTYDMMDISFVTPHEFNTSEEENTAADSFDTFVNADGEESAMDSIHIAPQLLDVVRRNINSTDPIMRCAVIKIIMYGIEGLTEYLFNNKVNQNDARYIAEVVAWHIDPDNEPDPAVRLFALRALSEVPLRYTDLLLTPTLKAVKHELAESRAGRECTVLLSMSLELLAHLLHRAAHEASAIQLDKPVLAFSDSDADCDDSDDDEGAEPGAEAEDDEWEDEEGDVTEGDQSNGSASAAEGGSTGDDDDEEKDEEDAAAARRALVPIRSIAEELIDNLISGPLRSTHAVVAVQAMDTIAGLLRCPKLPVAAVGKAVRFAVSYLQSNSVAAVDDSAPVALRTLRGEVRTVTYHHTERFAFLRDKIEHEALSAIWCSLYSFFVRRSKIDPQQEELFRQDVVRPVAAVMRRLLDEGRLDLSTYLGASAMDTWNILIQICRTKDVDVLEQHLNSALGFVMSVAALPVDMDPVPVSSLSEEEVAHPDTEKQTVVDQGVRKEVAVSYRKQLTVNARDRAIAAVRVAAACVPRRLARKYLYDLAAATSCNLNIIWKQYELHEYAPAQLQMILRCEVEDLTLPQDTLSTIADAVSETQLNVREKHVLLAVMGHQPITAFNCLTMTRVWTRVTDRDAFWAAVSVFSPKHTTVAVYIADVLETSISLIRNVCRSYNRGLGVDEGEEDDDALYEEGFCEFAVSYTADFVGAIVRLAGLAEFISVVAHCLVPLQTFFNVPAHLETSLAVQLPRCATLCTASALVSNFDPRWGWDEVRPYFPCILLELRRALRRAALTTKERTKLIAAAATKDVGKGAKGSKRKSTAASAAKPAKSVPLESDAFFLSTESWDETDVAGEARTAFSTLATLYRRTRGAPDDFARYIHHEAGVLYSLVRAFFERKDITNTGPWRPTYANACTALTALAGGELAPSSGIPVMINPPGWESSGEMPGVEGYDFPFAVQKLSGCVPFKGDAEEFPRTTLEVRHWFTGRHSVAQRHLRDMCAASTAQRAMVSKLYTVVEPTLSAEEQSAVKAWI